MIRSAARKGGRFGGTARGLLLILAFALLPVTTFAHAKLVRSEPKRNSTVEQPPKLIELWFNEELEPGFNTIEVKDGQGTRVDRGEVTLAEGNKKAQVALEGVGAGTYTVAWKALSMDEHMLRGTFTFTVTAAAVSASTAPTPGQTPAAPETEQPGQVEVQTGSTPEAADAGGVDEIPYGLSAVRWLSYLAMMTLFGGFAFHLLVLAPALSQSRAGDTAGDEGTGGACARRIVHLSGISVALLAIASLTALVLQASTVFDKPLGESLSPSLLGRVITETGYGGHWLLQVLSTAALTVILFILHGRLKRAPSEKHTAIWWAGLVAGAVLLVAPSWTGHAAAAAKDYRFAIVTDWLHLLAGGFWVGGLFHLALALPLTLSPLDSRERTRLLHQVIRLFTRIAMPSVAILVLAGLYNTWVHVPSFQDLWLTPYGKTLLVKLLLVALMLILGGLHNFYYGKRAARLSGAEGDAPEGPAHEKLSHGFSRSVALEAAIALVVLLVTAALVFMTPARSHPAMTPSEHPAMSSAGIGPAVRR